MKDLFFDNECWYQQGCPLLTETCKKTCHRYLEMNYLISNCGMPNATKYLKKIRPVKDDEAAYRELKKIKDNIVDFVRQGRNLYICSAKCGNGKTTWALKLLYKYFDEIWNGNGFKKKGYFLYVPEFVNNLKYSEYRNSNECKDLFELIKRMDIVVWDDIGSSSITAADHNNLISLIGSRCLNDKSNIFTGNLLDEELRTTLGERLYDRIWNMSHRVQLVSPSRREY